MGTGCTSVVLVNNSTPILTSPALFNGAEVGGEVWEGGQTLWSLRCWENTMFHSGLASTQVHDGMEARLTNRHDSWLSTKDGLQDKLDLQITSHLATHDHMSLREDHKLQKMYSGLHYVPNGCPHDWRDTHKSPQFPQIYYWGVKLFMHIWGALRNILHYFK